MGGSADGGALGSFIELFGEGRMNESQIRSLLVDYLDWQLEHWKDYGGVDILPNGAARITTPFLDRHNDAITVCVVEGPDGMLTLSDDGYVIPHMRQAGYWATREDQKTHVEGHIKQFGLVLNEDEIQITGPRAQFPQ